MGVMLTAYSLHKQTTLNIFETPSKFRLHSPKKSVRHVLSTKRRGTNACTDTFVFQSRVFFVASSLRACTKASQHPYQKSSSLPHYLWLFSTVHTLRCVRLLTYSTSLRLKLHDEISIVLMQSLQHAAYTSKLLYKIYST